MGALASGGVRVMNEEITDRFGISQAVIERAAGREQLELERRERLYRGDRSPPAVQGRTIILIDDGLATGSTMRAAAAALRQMGPEKVIVAVPVAAAETCEALRSEVDEVVCVETPEPFLAVGAWYADFSQTSDDQVRELLEKAGDSKTAVNHAGHTLH
jgi:putative phosphoribosyl transferase